MPRNDTAECELVFVISVVSVANNHRNTPQAV
jgi:hypothetical protein